ncbi:Cation-transporting ATPase [Dissulfuribacter thermophilus]|uniref:Cation-transporting ATPase n=1 Tax=Dissulfuribacter thermophilus TaxID=1156395 RepID=A0A1B9F4U7_9BACT|nr:cation-transporting P-type ATPase [Dissulfuribacter thermophilus]OCC14845.1 Cation-transporting ATPase [Dissulfuribacter thermophilus]
MTRLTGYKWHSLSAEQVVDLLETDPDKGLTTEEVKRRLESFGPNVITKKKGRGPLMRFLLQFNQPLIYILLISSIVTALLREWVDSGVIFGVVLVNAIIGYLQEAKAVSALSALAKTMTTRAMVIRDGQKKEVPSTEVVPGDVVLLSSGDKVPADIRLYGVRDLRIDESALTGESLSVEKSADPVPADTLLADRKNMAYATTLVTYGRGLGVVTATGDHTEVGRISELISTAEELETPLTRKISEFSKILLYVILGLAAMVVAVGMLRGKPFLDMFMAAVALAVGAIPEGLPAAVTITLAIGVSRMAKRRAIIRKLPAVETLGSTTVICSDKTGTLTQNQMTVQEILAGGVWYEVSGSGYNPFSGKILKEGEKIELDNYPELKLCLLAGALCNDSVLKNDGENWEVQGDPTEGALLVAAIKGGLDLEQIKRFYPRLDTIPFESEFQYMATLHDTYDREKRLVFVKGSVEAITHRCSVQLSANGEFSELKKDDIAKRVHLMAEQGLRVLAFAIKEMPGNLSSITHEDVSSGLIFLGLVAMLDPPRVEAIEAVNHCKAAGIKVKMITGDHAATATAIARKLGLYDPGVSDEIATKVLTGKDLETMTNKELSDQVDKTVVFARVAPEQKLRLVEALQSKGNVVAMTGDGVNDAPALKRADIGIAMGITGTEVSKEAADMVLTDDNFKSIVAAVEEGRGVFDNLTKFIVWTLPTNIGEGLVILAAILLGVTLPILPVQILWINMTTAGFLGLMLAFEPKELDIMRRPPRDPRIPILTRSLATRILLVGGLLLIVAFGLFKWELTHGSSLAQARTVAVNVFVMVELCYLFNCRSLTKSVFHLGFFSNPWVFGGTTAMLLLQLVYTYFGPMNLVFQSQPISIESWARIFAVGIMSFFIVEIEKWINSLKSNGSH